uniref:Uncharacterized protein n=1 Tax=Ditylenchus dipsaci TaxID=166011 RepID=A0A915D9A3_9BILA
MQSYRYRNSRSVNSTPIRREKKLFSHDNYDAMTDSENNDDWRNTERILLEELKNVTSERNIARGKNERDYTVEEWAKRQAGTTRRM